MPKQEDPPAGAPLWMATFSDLVTLLLTFFVMLMAMANFDDNKKLDAVLVSIREAFGTQGYDRSRLGTSRDEGNTRDRRSEDTMQPVHAKLMALLQKHISDQRVFMDQSSDEVRIVLDEQVFFRPGSATLHPSAYVLLADVAEVIAETDVHVRVEGYADHNGEELANWTLSSERSLAVVMALREKGPVPGDHLEAVAHGAFHSNSAAGADPSWLRRIELVLEADTHAGKAAATSLSNRGERDAGQ